MTVHSYATCQGKAEVDNLKSWQESQNSHLENIDSYLNKLVQAQAKREGAEGMLKWILGWVGFAGLASLVAAVLQIVG